MKLVKDGLEIFIEEWDDPGVYPSNAGGMPLASYSYPILEGEILIEMDKVPTTKELLSFLKLECHYGKAVTEWDWDVMFKDGKILVSASPREVCEAALSEQPF